MKQIVLNVKNNQLPFVKKLLKQLDCVEIQDEKDAKEALVARLSKAFQDGKLAKQGKLKTIPVKDFLHEL